MSKDGNIWAVTFAIWMVGVGILYVFWNFHFPNDMVDLIWGGALYIIAFFYVLALGPIRDFVDYRVFRGRRN
ncbi:hypothetical protein [Pelagibacterium halotolerans]|uniref:hypothetical protein n=1 Tax=Pelagibacterium halotolerans TaxID=531813 RepID=UPI00384C452A